MVGRTLQRYRLVEEVGHGGMAVVYRGVDEGLERDVAVKLLHPHLASRPEHRRRLMREAKAVARLKHPNILEIFDFSGEDISEAFIVTELIQGETLRSFAVAHPFDPPELAAACVWVIAGALSHAHAQGIVHRDLKPENVMIQRAGQAPVLKLMDFGIAQILDRDERMTVTGSLIGSPAHMAPEIIDGEEADERSDIFSLGTMLYWLITGQLPFEGPSPGALLKQILSGEFTDVRALKPGVSDKLADVVAQSLARERVNRIPNALTFQELLAASLDDVGLTRPADLVNRFLASPEEESIATRTQVVSHLLETGNAAAKARRTGKALQAYGRVISIVPGTPEAGAARQAIDRLNSRRRWRRVAGLAGGIAAVLGAGFALRPVIDKMLPKPPPPVVLAPKVEPPVVAAVTPPRPVVAIPKVAPPPVVAEAPKVTDKKPDLPVVAAVADIHPDDSHKPTHRDRVPVAMAGLKVIMSPIVGAVYIDGKQVSGYVPQFETDLPVGQHSIEIKHPECCEDAPQKVELERDAPRKEIRIRLLPKPAELTVNIDGPPDTSIIVDDAWRGTAAEKGGKPIKIALRPDGEGRPQYKQDVTLRLRRDGYREQVVPVSLSAGGSQKISVKMLPQG